MLEVVRHFNGHFVTVDEADIGEALKEMNRRGNHRRSEESAFIHTRRNQGSLGHNGPWTEGWSCLQFQPLNNPQHNSPGSTSMGNPIFFFFS